MPRLYNVSIIVVGNIFGNVFENFSNLIFFRGLKMHAIVVHGLGQTLAYRIEIWSPHVGVRAALALWRTKGIILVATALLTLHHQVSRIYILGIFLQRSSPWGFALEAGQFW
jgi:hypothetical protein